MNTTPSHTNLYVQTPLVEACSLVSSSKIFLKLENTQPSGSFKTRGISHHCQSLKDRGCRHFVSSSGGNAGLAVAYCGWKLGIKTSVFVPTSTPAHVINKLKDKNAEVYVEGTVWDHTNQHAKDFVKIHENENAYLVHPFDNPEIWDGHSSLVFEIKEAMKAPPDAIILSVGGGGLLCGVLRGLHKIGWAHVPVVTCETYGADCFYKAVEAGKIVTLTEISSIAKSLGALTVAEDAFLWTKSHKIIPVRVHDEEATDACLKFADDYKMLVEPACGAALTCLYGETLKRLEIAGQLKKLESVVIIVCGGHSVTIQNMRDWQERKTS